MTVQFERQSISGYLDCMQLCSAKCVCIALEVLKGKDSVDRVT